MRDTAQKPGFQGALRPVNIIYLCRNNILNLLANQLLYSHQEFALAGSIRPTEIADSRRLTGAAVADNGV